MINIAFWNTYKNERINPVLADFIHSYDLDILLVCEYSADPNNLIFDKHVLDKELTVVPEITETEGVKLFYSKKSTVYEALHRGQKRYCIHEFSHNGINFVICVVHFPSKMYGDNSVDVQLHGQDALTEIALIEEKRRNKHTLIVGDFNTDPYESAMIQATCFHTYQDRKDSINPKRIVNAERYPFYNPMWNKFGDNDNPPGTYYFSKPGRLPMWHMFDQVILRYDMMRYFIPDSLQILTHTDKYDYRDSDGRPNKDMVSDHFPILFSLGGSRND